MNLGEAIMFMFRFPDVELREEQTGMIWKYSIYTGWRCKIHEFDYSGNILSKSRLNNTFTEMK